MGAGQARRVPCSCKIWWQEQKGVYATLRYFVNVSHHRSAVTKNMVDVTRNMGPCCSALVGVLYFIST